VASNEWRIEVPQWEELVYTPAFFGKSADLSEGKRVVKRSWCKERKERAKSAAEKKKLQVELETSG
jgi:hypothetical protein